MAAALRQQFPNDGYLLRSDHVRGVRLASFEEVGDACDFAFGISVAQANPRRHFYFVNRVTSQYRVHQTQVSRRPTLYPMLRVLEGIAENGLDDMARAALIDAKDGLATRSVRELLAVGRGREARAIILSKSMRFRAQPMRNIACLALSYISSGAVRAYFEKHAARAGR
jgi:hypothetical protein